MPDGHQPAKAKDKNILKSQNKKKIKMKNLKGKAKQQKKNEGKKTLPLVLLLFWLFVNFQLD